MLSIEEAHADPLQQKGPYAFGAAVGHRTVRRELGVWAALPCALRPIRMILACITANGNEDFEVSKVELPCTVCHTRPYHSVLPARTSIFGEVDKGW